MLPPNSVKQTNFDYFGVLLTFASSSYQRKEKDFLTEQPIGDGKSLRALLLHSRPRWLCGTLIPKTGYQPRILQPLHGYCDYHSCCFCHCIPNCLVYHHNFPLQVVEGNTKGNSIDWDAVSNDLHITHIQSKVQGSPWCGSRLSHE